MPLNIPYIFRAGTKAKANEVNANFQEVTRFTNQLESNSAANETEIALLKEDKADKNGSTTEIFKAANAVTGKDVVNKDTLRNLTSNTIDVVRGMRLGTSTNKSILCTAGDCWDSGYTKMITSTSNMTINITGVGANTTQYIYVCDGPVGSGKVPTLAISTSPTTVTLPEGYEYYRKLGWFSTDNASNIKEIANDDQVNLNTRVGFIGPGISGALRTSTTYTSEANHWVYLYAGYKEKYNNTIIMTVDGIVVANLSASWTGNATSSALIPVKLGQVVSISISRDNGVTYWQQLSMI